MDLLMCEKEGDVAVPSELEPLTLDLPKGVKGQEKWSVKIYFPITASSNPGS